MKYFVRADVDSVLPLHFLLPLLPKAAAGGVLQLPSVQCGGGARWKKAHIGRLPGAQRVHLH